METDPVAARRPALTLSAPESHAMAVKRGAGDPERRIALWGIFGTHNFGNECTLHAMLEGARRHEPSSRFLVICAQPDDARARHGVDAVPIAPDPEFGLIRTGERSPRLARWAREIADWGRVLRIVRSVDHLLMPGTGLLTDVHESLVGTPYQLLKWTLAARLCGKPVSYVSVGAEALVHPVKSRFIQHALRLATYRSYRDPHSRERVRKLLRAAATDPIYPDLAFSLPAGLLKTDRSQPPGMLTVAVGIYAVEGGAANVASYVETIGIFVKHLLQGGYGVRIVYGDAEYDDGVRIQLMAWLEAEGLGGSVLYEDADSFETLLQQIAACDLMVATRFHNILMAMLLGKPVVSVSHMDKNDQLMEMMGLSEFVLPLAKATPGALADLFARLEGGRERVRQQIEQKAEQFRQQLETQYGLLFGQALGTRAEPVES